MVTIGMNETNCRPLVLLIARHYFSPLDSRYSNHRPLAWALQRGLAAVQMQPVGGRISRWLYYSALHSLKTYSPHSSQFPSSSIILFNCCKARCRSFNFNSAFFHSYKGFRSDFLVGKIMFFTRTILKEKISFHTIILY